MAQKFWSCPLLPCKIAGGAFRPEVILDRSTLRRSLAIQVVEGRLQCESTVAAGTWPPASFENLGKIRLGSSASSSGGWEIKIAKMIG